MQRFCRFVSCRVFARSRQRKINGRGMMTTSVAALCMVLSGTAHAIYIHEDTTMDFKYTASTFEKRHFVGFESFFNHVQNIRPTSPTVTIVDGAEFESLTALNASTINMAGGDVRTRARPVALAVREHIASS